MKHIRQGKKKIQEPFCQNLTELLKEQEDSDDSSSGS
jgi:hypothetical protein